MTHSEQSVGSYITPYCRENPSSSRCTSIYGIEMGGASTGIPGPRSELYWKLVDRSRWVPLESQEIEAIKQEVATINAAFPESSRERSLALASFYAQHNLELLRIHELDAALSSFAGKPEPGLTLELMKALREAGFLEAGLLICDQIPEAVRSSDSAAMQILGSAMFNRGRILEDLKRFDEAESSFAYAQHMYTAAGMLSR